MEPHHPWRAPEATVHRRSAASCLARCAHCDPLPQPRSWRVRDGSRRVPGSTAEAVRPRRKNRCPKGVGPHPGPRIPKGVGPHPGPGTPRGWAAAMGALREARSQLAAERTPDLPGGTAPPVAEQAGRCTAARRQAVSLAALTATHCRSLGRDGSTTVPGGYLDTPPRQYGHDTRTGAPRGLDHTQGRAPPGGLDHTQDRVPPGGGLRQWVRFAKRGHSLPPNARRTCQVEPRHRWPSRREGAPPLGGKLSRSLRSLRPIATASAVTGPRRSPEGAWTHRRGSTATAQEPVPPGGWTTPRTGHPEGVGCGNGCASRSAVTACRRAHAALAHRNRTTRGGLPRQRHTAARRQAVSLAALTATHCRSLGRGGSATVPGGYLNTPPRRSGHDTRTGARRGSDHIQDRAPRRGLGHTQEIGRAHV